MPPGKLLNRCNHCSEMGWEGHSKGGKPEDLPIANKYSRLSGEKHGI